MRRNQILIIAILLLFIVTLFLYMYVFNIYEVSYSVSSNKLFADNTSKTSIKVIPLNAFGWKVPFRNSPAKFEIVEGGDLVDVIDQNIDTGYLVIKAKNRTGKVVIRIKPKYALLPSEVEINIEPNVT